MSGTELNGVNQETTEREQKVERVIHANPVSHESTDFANVRNNEPGARGAESSADIIMAGANR